MSRNPRRWSLVPALVIAVVSGGGCDADSPTDPTPPPWTCNYLASPSEFTPCMAAPDELTLAVTTGETCVWSASANVPWLTPAATGRGTGSGPVVFRISDNWDAPREALITLTGLLPQQTQDVRVKQAGCRYGVIPNVFDVPSTGGTFLFQVTQQSDPIGCGGPLQNACLWSAEPGSTWIAITSPMPRTGDQPVEFSVSSNNSAAARSSTITVRDQIVSITQRGR